MVISWIVEEIDLCATFEWKYHHHSYFDFHTSGVIMHEGSTNRSVLVQKVCYNCDVLALICT